MGVVVGIDLGTTNSCVAYVTKLGTVETISNSEGNKITPSVVQVNSADEIVVGDVAKKEKYLSEARVLWSALHEASEDLSERLLRKIEKYERNYECIQRK